MPESVSLGTAIYNDKDFMDEYPNPLIVFSHSVVSNSLQPHGLDCTTPSFPVLHYLSEFAQTHVH